MLFSLDGLRNGRQAGAIIYKPGSGFGVSIGHERTPILHPLLAIPAAAGVELSHPTTGSSATAATCTWTTTSVWCSGRPEVHPQSGQQPPPGARRALHRQPGRDARRPQPAAGRVRGAGLRHRAGAAGPLAAGAPGALLRQGLRSRPRPLSGSFARLHMYLDQPKPDGLLAESQLFAPARRTVSARPERHALADPNSGTCATICWPGWTSATVWRIRRPVRAGSLRLPAPVQEEDRHDPYAWLKRLRLEQGKRLLGSGLTGERGGADGRLLRSKPLPTTVSPGLRAHPGGSIASRCSRPEESRLQSLQPATPSCPMLSPPYRCPRSLCLPACF